MYLFLLYRLCLFKKFKCPNVKDKSQGKLLFVRIIRFTYYNLVLVNR